MRTSVLGIHCFEDIETVIKNTTDACRITHYDDRCVISCIMITMLVSKQLQNARKGEKTKPSELFENIFEKVLQIYQNNLKEMDLNQDTKEKNLNEFKWYCDKNRTLEDLQLDEKNSIGYTFKCMASSLFCFHNTENSSKDAEFFKSQISNLAKEGGGPKYFIFVFFFFFYFFFVLRC